MRRLTALTTACVLVLAGAGHVTALAADRPVDLGHQVLAANDGWASFSTGTTGGAAADDAHVFTVTTRQELIDALGGDNKKNATNATPKIIQVQGTIDASVDDSNQPVTCDAFADPGFTMDAYRAQFDPAVWGRQPVSGPLEDARKRSETNEGNRIQIRVGPNTTIVGLGGDATMVHVNLLVQNVDNVIVRNLEFQDAFDCFPQWTPTDGANGNWNSAFDNVSLTGATHVWMDHDSFNDGADPDSSLPTFFGRPFQVHDGLLDITKVADLVTVSWCVFREHDKTMLIGSSDNAPADVGKLRVTLHHNLFDGVLERAPRVRFGQVHVFNNLYVVPDATNYIYSWGAGIQGQAFIQSNFFATVPGFDPARIITVFNGTAMHAENTLVNGFSRHDQVDVVAAYNAEHDPDLNPDVGWTPTLFRRIDPPQAVPVLVPLFAGPGRVIG
jgi:pectate lyase